MKYVGTSTGRWSAKKPPIQEIPRYDEEKRKKLRQLAGIEPKAAPEPSRGLRMYPRRQWSVDIENIAFNRPDLFRTFWVEVRGRDAWGAPAFERFLWPEPPIPEEVNGPGPW